MSRYDPDESAPATSYTNQADGSDGIFRRTNIGGGASADGIEPSNSNEEKPLAVSELLYSSSSYYAIAKPGMFVNVFCSGSTIANCRLQYSLFSFHFRFHSHPDHDFFGIVGCLSQHGRDSRIRRSCHGSGISSLQYAKFKQRFSNTNDESGKYSYYGFCHLHDDVCDCPAVQIQVHEVPCRIHDAVLLYSSRCHGRESRPHWPLGL